MQIRVHSQKIHKFTKKIHKGYHSHVPYKDYLIIVYGKELSSKQTNFFHQKFLIDTNGKISGRILLLLLLTKIDILKYGCVSWKEGLTGIWITSSGVCGYSKGEDNTGS